MKSLFDHFTLDYFKSEKKKAIENLQEDIKVLESIQQVAEEIEKTEALLPSKPYKHAKLVNTVLTVVLNDGNLISKTEATKEDFEKVRGAATEEQILDIVITPEAKAKIQQAKTVQEAREKEQAINQQIINNFQDLEDTGEFEVKEGSLYFKGINRSVPKLLATELCSLVNTYESDEHFIESIEYQSLKKFWLKCCLNPNARSAEDLYDFLSHHKFKLDKHGNFYAYRRVVSKASENKALVEFVSNAYNKVKAVWKKRPLNYVVYKKSEDQTYYFTKISDIPNPINDGNECIGGLEKLYLDLPNMQDKSYTSAHTGKEDYRIGEVISMPRNEGDDSNLTSCSKGFHAASKAYDYSGFGDTPILVIINPMDVLSVPQGEVGKLRTCRWFFAMTLPEQEKYILDDEDFDVTDLGDVFEEKCLANMQEYVQNSFAEEVKRHTFNLSPINNVEVAKIVTTLDDMKAALTKRIVTVD